MDLSVVVPAHNEAMRLGPMLDSLVEYTRSSPLRVEVIVVDDGSTDGTPSLARDHVMAMAHAQVVCLPSNFGKGKAVAAGMALARGRYRAFLDADGATAPSQLDPLLAAVAARPRTVAIGSIRVPGALVRNRQPLTRRIAARLGNRLIQATVLPGIRDTQRGAKMFPAELADSIFPQLEIRGWGFDVEVLALTRAAGYKIVEVPIRWEHRGGGGVRSGAYLRTLIDVFAVRRRVRREASSPRRTAPRVEPRRVAAGLAPLDHNRS